MSNFVIELRGTKSIQANLPVAPFISTILRLCIRFHGRNVVYAMWEIPSILKAKKMDVAIFQHSDV